MRLLLVLLAATALFADHASAAQQRGSSPDGDNPAAPETAVATPRDLGKARTLSLHLQPDSGYTAVISPKS